MVDFVYPYSTAFFMDTLPVESVVFDIVRYDEFDAIGTGHDLQAEMADPKWKATLVMRDYVLNADQRAIAAKVRKLDGGQYSFMVYDPSNPYPAFDPTGSIIGANNVQVNSLGANGSSLSLKGLTNAYRMTIGDKMQMNFGTDSVYFAEVSETVTANVSGVTAVFEVFPHVPVGIAVNQVVNLKKPACKMSLMPGAFSPGRTQGILSPGMSIDAMEHI